MKKSAFLLYKIRIQNKMSVQHLRASFSSKLTLFTVRIIRLGRRPTLFLCRRAVELV